MKKIIVLILMVISFCCGVFVGENTDGNFFNDVGSFYNSDVELYGCPRAKKVAKPKTKKKFLNKF